MFKIGFSGNKKNVISKLIKLFTKSKWSHVFIELVPVGNDALILEATRGGVQFNLLSKYTNHPEKYELELFKIDDSIEILLPVLQKHLHDDYGY